MTSTDMLPEEAGHPRRAWSRLYRGETRFDFVGRRRWWALVSGIVIIAGLASLGVRGLNLGIDFKGGTSWQVPAHGVTVAQATTAVKAVGVTPSVVEGLGVGSSATLQVQADLSKLPVAQRTTVEDTVATALAHVTHSSVSNAEKNITDIGPTWGSQITNKAILAVIVFFIVVVIYISFRFEWKMAIAALVAVLHDLLVVAGVYSLSGLQVTPDTVVAVLTILGYSLYDTVVVFDRVADNAKGLGSRGTMTYEDVVNLSMNQTLARSINTSLVAILPVLSVLVVGAEILGATTLQYFGFALVIGLLSGAYSSIFIASPLLAVLKEREPRYRSIRQKLSSRGDRTGLLTPKAAAQLAFATGGGRGSTGAGNARPVRRSGQPSRPGSSARSGASARVGELGGDSSAVLRPGAAGRAAARRATTVGEVDQPIVGEGAGDALGQPSNGATARAVQPTGQSQRQRPSSSSAHRPSSSASRKKGKKKGGRRR